MNTSSSDSSEIERKQEVSTSLEKEIKVSPEIQEFSVSLAALPTPEEKIAFGLQFLRKTLSQEGTPRFRDFWEARRQILPCFKLNLNPTMRSKLWTEYVELTVEARRLKEILEEQSAFAVEQIDLAIRSIEEDLARLGALVEQAPPILNGGDSETIGHRMSEYGPIQKELNLLNALASRLNSLRKEVIKTEMRIRFKAKFLKKLSELGDLVFPKRKEWIDKISTFFEQDIDQFIAKHFKGKEVVGAPYYVVREEIKALQAVAKVFTLNSGAFNRTRLKLSACWDQVRELEIAHRKEITEKRQQSSVQREPIDRKIEELKAKANEMTLDLLDKELDAVSEEMQSLSLSRDDIRYLREEFSKLRAPHIALKEQKQRELEEQQKEQLRLKREKMAYLSLEMSALQKDGANLELEVLSERFNALKLQIEGLELSKMEK
ncbi:MAG: hypothetical protein FJZ64_03065, partial [Chlamydiae bacterium]|nr:hypothetical protein [Chlamydiota bacterium]